MSTRSKLKALGVRIKDSRSGPEGVGLWV